MSVVPTGARMDMDFEKEMWINGTAVDTLDYLGGRAFVEHGDLRRHDGCRRDFTGEEFSGPKMLQHLSQKTIIVTRRSSWRRLSCITGDDRPRDTYENTMFILCRFERATKGPENINST